MRLLWRQQVGTQTCYVLYSTSFPLSFVSPRLVNNISGHPSRLEKALSSLQSVVRNIISRRRGGVMYMEYLQYQWTLTSTCMAIRGSMIHNNTARSRNLETSEGGYLDAAWRHIVGISMGRDFQARAEQSYSRVEFFVFIMCRTVPTRFFAPNVTRPIHSIIFGSEWVGGLNGRKVE